MRKLTVLLFAVFIVVAFALPAQAQKPIKIGAVYTFTGAMAFLNEGIVDGHAMAIDEINKA
jgi:ABC-type branched-subunit amino acid transport system substrate-binding protein